ncbi:DUF2779 domain-containing protein [Sulfuriroseicoccus oceanibius]|uniref:DUF2779 domain-containing protein n=1 Tax=Sulfuriroseicoccus oceanibius TaxID=2707525 RepID=A0A6B3L169_9BACT|nr:DUF2779 domain-containing protein [Sulfuriroseicoccus oceanibius]QQL43752.1 DUF2779 domain-containing protein [Sulfuriroseicoccus oceanibius]
MPRSLSKSKIIAFRQCPKRLWLEVHSPELRDDSRSEVVFAIGNQVGEVAQALYATQGESEIIDFQQEGFANAINRSRHLLQSGSKILFEAGVQSAGGHAFADVMIPVRNGNGTAWRMIEVKSSTKLKDYYRDDVAVQTYIATQAGVTIDSAALAHINNQFVYQGNGNYHGLFTENDLTAEAMGRHDEVAGWIRQAHDVAACTSEPNIQPGSQCSDPFECPFIDHCHAHLPKATHPVTHLPRIQRTKVERLESMGIREMADVPDHELNRTQQRVKEHTLAGTCYFDRERAAAALEGLGYPAYFLDFETANLAVPVWKGTRPFQQIPFQFSLHQLNQSSTLTHTGFLNLSGNDPRIGFAEALIAHCGTTGPVYVYNAAFERRIINECAAAIPSLAPPLHAIANRLVDLLPIAREHFYHPDQCGSWSIKAVLPALCPDLNYNDLDGVKDGGMAVEAFSEAIAATTSAQRKDQLREQLEEYCKLDTLAMVRMWQEFGGDR